MESIKKSKSNQNLPSDKKNNIQDQSKKNLSQNAKTLDNISMIDKKQKSENKNQTKIYQQSKEKKVKGNIKFVFKNVKANSLFALAMVFAISILSVCSVLIAGNFTTNQVITANVANTRIVQAKLAELGYYNQAIDGIYDNDTIAAVKNYQQDNNLTVTGNLDQSTTTALGVTDNTQANTDLYLLAKLIYSEARGEIYEGQVAVGAVVLNRVRDAGFPNTIQGVIYQPWAFTALNDGQFALEPNSTAYQAAQDAMNGWDPTYGCIFYYNPVTATSSWIFSREIIVRIGNHVFCI